MWIEEREAYLVWCPQSRVMVKTPYGDGAANRGSGVDKGSHHDPETLTGCKGMGCAMWRWGYLTPHAEGTMRACQVGADPAKYPENQRFKPRNGYCGLAGKPNA